MIEQAVAEMMQAQEVWSAENAAAKATKFIESNTKKSDFYGYSSRYSDKEIDNFKYINRNDDDKRQIVDHNQKVIINIGGDFDDDMLDKLLFVIKDKSKNFDPNASDYSPHGKNPPVAAPEKSG